MFTILVSLLGCVCDLFRIVRGTVVGDHERIDVPVTVAAAPAHILQSMLIALALDRLVDAEQCHDCISFVMSDQYISILLAL